MVLFCSGYVLAVAVIMSPHSTLKPGEVQRFKTGFRKSSGISWKYPKFLMLIYRLLYLWVGPNNWRKCNPFDLSTDDNMDIKMPYTCTLLQLKVMYIAHCRSAQHPKLTYKSNDMSGPGSPSMSLT